MIIKKILFIGLISLLSSANLFSENLTLEEHIKNELQAIEKKYLESNNYEKGNLIRERRWLAYGKIRYSFPVPNRDIIPSFEKNTKNWYDFGEKEAEFSMYLKSKYEINTFVIDGNIESSFFKNEDYDRIIEWAKLIDKLYEKSLNFNITKKTKLEYERQNKKMERKYDELFNLVKGDIYTYNSSLSVFPQPCIRDYFDSNGLPDSQEKWLEFRENEAQMYFILSNKDEGVYYGKLFEITKRRTDYLENILNSIRKSEKYKKLEN